MTPQVVLITITHESGITSRMQFCVKLGHGDIDPHVAGIHGFTETETGWEREPLEALIQMEIERTLFPETVMRDGEEVAVGKPIKWEIAG